MGWFLAAMVLLGLLIVLGAAKVSGRESAVERAEEARVMQIREDRLAPEVTPVPAPEPVTWARYDVPLEDDLQRYIYDLCQAYGVDMPLVLAVIDVESDFQADMIGDYGESYGLMQIHVEDHRERCIELGAWNLFDPRANVRVGIDYLAELIGWGHGVEYALSWYNGHGGALPWYYVDEVQARAAEIRETETIERR